MADMHPGPTGQEALEQLTIAARALRCALGASVVEVVGPADAEQMFASTGSAARGVRQPDRVELRDVVRAELARDGSQTERRLELDEVGLVVHVLPLLSEGGHSVAALAVARVEDSAEWSMRDEEEIRARRHVMRLAADRIYVEAKAQRQRRLDELVTRVAVRLMAASSATLPDVIEWTLQSLAAFFAIDTAFLRHHDHEAGTTTLVDEWPRRENVPDPDPLGVVPFDADEVFAATRELNAPLVVDAATAPKDYLERVERGSGVPAVSTAAVPLRREDVTNGVLGFVTYRERQWSEEELNALQAIGSLVVQLQARIEAEELLQASTLQRHLDELVTRVAVRLMSASRDSVSLVIEWTLRTLGEFFEVDTVYLRRNDHEANVTILVDEWPRRQDVPDPDPLGVVPFDADPVFAAIKHLNEPFVMRPQASPQEYLERVEQGSGIPEISMAMVPLLHEDVTEGVLGFVNFGDRPWRTEEINALQAIASLLLQLQARIDAEERLHHSAYHDTLTGLANRESLLDELERRAESDLDASSALLFLDFDHFKTVNDALGHQTGDRLLVATADRLRTAVRPDDFVARMIGDEFVVLLGAPVDRLEAFSAAERIRELVAQPVEAGGNAVNRTISIGVAMGGLAKVAGSELLVQADTALQIAKSKGRNQIVFFDEELQAVMHERFDTELLLRRAIQDSRLELHYQPEVDLRDGRLLAVEALVRWHHPSRGLLPAGVFITVAEESGFIVEIGDWVLDEAIRQRAVWMQQFPKLNLMMRINVSPAQLMGGSLVEKVAACLERHGVPGSSLCFEITEHAVMADIDHALLVLEQLRALGVEIAIDDFGIGHSSMAQLKRLPTATLKIDQSFVAGLPTDPGDRAIVESIVRLADAFDVGLVAEGVETHEQVEELLKLGCYRAQGFLFAEALPVDGLEPMLDREERLAASLTSTT